MGNKRKIFIGAILAGFCIGIGGGIFLSIDDKIIGSCLFSIGLFLVLVMNLNLFTGKICYAMKMEDYKNAGIIWAGNFIGAGLIATIISFTRCAGISERAKILCETKLNDSLFSLFLLGFLCNIFIFAAVDNFKNNQHEIGKYIGIFLGVMGFILLGTEHCVADMFYFVMAGNLSLSAVSRLIIITFGNVCGGLACGRVMENYKKG